MLRKKLDFLKALSTYTGTIIGVGIFGLPYVAMKAGFFVVLIYFVLLTLLTIIVNKFFGEMCCDTEKLARVPGYAEEYLGPKAKKFSFFVSSLVLIGALLAYLILGSEFFYLLAKDFFGGSFLIYVLLFFTAGAFFIYKGIKRIAQFEFAMLIVFFLILIFFFLKSLPFINFQHFTTFDSRYLTFPYGVVLFSLGGLAVVPEIKEMVERDRKTLKKVIVLGIIIAALSYLIFIFSFLGACGPKTTKNAISCFVPLINPKIILVGYLFGLITTFTSFITLGLTLKKMFSYDFKIPEKISWLIACFLPLIIYFLGAKNFLDVIGLTGAILLGTESILIILIYKNFIEKRFQRPAPWTIYLILISLFLGIIFEIIYLLSKEA